MGVMAGSAGRNRAIVTGIVGAMLGLLVGISITTFSVNADERESAATGPGRAAGGLVEPWLFEASLERESAATGPGRAAGGLVEPWLFEASLERESAATGPGRAAGGLVEPWLFEASLERK